MITQFGRDDKNFGTGGAGGRWGTGALAGLSLHKNKAVVEVTARLVEKPGEILASVVGHGESTRSSSDMAGGGASGWKGAAVAWIWEAVTLVSRSSAKR